MARISNDPIPKGTQYYRQLLSSPDKMADTRDALSSLIGYGNSIKLDDRNALLSTLKESLGEGAAAKIFSHVFLFNQRPDIQQLPLEEKIRTFYDLGSQQPDVQNIINKSRSIGYGPLAGFRSSPFQANRSLQKLSTEGKEQIGKKILLKILK